LSGWVADSDLVREPQKIATIDLDSTIIESSKAGATYLPRGRGYQPMLDVWAEMNLIVVRPVSQWERPGSTGAAGRGATGV